MRIACCLLLLFAAPSAAWALEPGAEGRCVAVVDGDTLVLEDGQEVRLVGIQAPKLPLGRPDIEAWPLAEEAKAALEDLALGETLELFFGGRQQDRYARLLAHLYSESGRWLQGELLKAGRARVYSFADNRALIPEMLALEAEARAAGRGIWAEPYYRIRTPDEAAGDVGSFQLVEGRVVDAALVKGKAYLNFGADWRTDFTIALPASALKLFEDAGVDPAAFEGHIVRVRGWIKSFNGPMIEATHPEQIEVLS